MLSEVYLLSVWQFVFVCLFIFICDTKFHNVWLGYCLKGANKPANIMVQDLDSNTGCPHPKACCPGPSESTS